MASSSRKVNLLGKRKQETKPFLRKHKEKETKSNLISVKEDALRKKTLFVANLFSQTQITDIINFFKDVAQVARVRLVLDHKGRHMGYGYVDFVSSNDAKKALEKKNGQYLHLCKIILDEPLYFVEDVPVPKKTLFITHLSRQTVEISDIIDFFKDVGQVVRVRLVVDCRGILSGCGFVEFASANEAEKALQMKNREYFHDSYIYLDVPYLGATYLPPPKYCLDHKVWYEEDYRPIQEDAAVEGPPDDFAEGVLLIANLSSQTTRIMHIIRFFKDVGKVVGVRLIVNHEGKHVGIGFVQFASAYEAEKALEEKNGEYLHDHKILLMKGLDKTPDFYETVGIVRNKTLFVDNLSCQTQISDIINFFKGIAEVDYVRLIVDQWDHLMGHGFVGFASADEANKALEKKNGEILHDCEIFLGVADIGARCLRATTYCIDHKVRYEDDYLQRESLLVEEDVAAVEGLDETPDFAEEVAVRKKTVFVAKLFDNIKNEDIIKVFKDFTVVRVRHIVDDWGKHVGCCFVELATASEAKKAVQKKDGSNFFVNVAEIYRPYPFRPKYNLADIEKLWYDDNLLRKNLTKRNRHRDLTTRYQSQSKRTVFSDDE